jgi:hypothetical protein
VEALIASHYTLLMRFILVELGARSTDHRVPLYCDNTGVVGISSNDTIGLTNFNRWMMVYYFRFHHFQRSGDIAVRRISTKENPRGLLHEEHRNLIHSRTATILRSRAPLVTKRSL